MKVLIVSDTHGRSEKLDKVIDLEWPFQALVHCGDIEGDEDYIRARVNCACYMVAGNNDWFSDLRRELELEIAGHKTLITHGHTYGVSMGIEGIRAEGRSRGDRIVMFGHIHRPVLEEYGDITIVNPGSLTYPRQMDRKCTYMIMETDQKGCPKFTIKHVN